MATDVVVRSLDIKELSVVVSREFARPDALEMRRTAPVTWRILRADTGAVPAPAPVTTLRIDGFRQGKLRGGRIDGKALRVGSP